ncbi:MAG: polysaccharide biosynthesis tyrosine autokinase, partial [Acidobacteriota bacterium]|nr:polysaccharide biosynthesis tyrosine autokinase [Acidobacteriota bacterium]
MQESESTGMYPRPLSFLSLAIKYKFVLVAGMLFGLLFGSAISLMQTRTFRAESNIEVQQINENYFNLRDVDPNPPPGALSIEPYIQTQIEILQSDVLIDLVIAKLGVSRRFELSTKPGIVERVKSRFGSPAPNHPSDGSAEISTELTSKVRSKLKVEPEKQSQIIRVSFQSQDPVFAAAFVNTLVDEYVRQSSDGRWSGSKAISSNIDDLKKKLESSERALQDYASSAGLSSVSGNDTLAQEELKTIQSELPRAEADRIAREAALEMVKNVSISSIPQALDNGALHDDTVQLTSLRKQMAELSTLLQPGNYKVVRVREQISSVEASLSEELQNVKTRVESDYKEALVRESRLRAAYEEHSRRVAEQAAKAVQLHVLESDVNTDKQIYSAMLGRAKEAHVAAELRPPSIRLLGVAKAPTKPFKPNVPLNAALGTFAGLWLAVGTSALLERSNRRILGPGDARMLLNIAELGAVPQISTKEAVLNGSVNYDNQLPNRAELIAMETTVSRTSESFRNIVASMVADRVGNAKPRILLFASASPMEGKTTVICNLALALTEAGRSVVLVDCDLRRPRLQEIFNVPNTWGLRDLINTQSELGEVPVRSWVKHTRISNLHVLPSGPGADNITELLYSAQFTRILERLRQEFDYVLVDSPAMLCFADARILARSCDAVILIHRANQTTQAAAISTLEMLAADGAPILGTILNGCAVDSVIEGYGNSHYSRYAGKQS